MYVLKNGLYYFDFTASLDSLETLSNNTEIKWEIGLKPVLKHGKIKSDGTVCNEWKGIPWRSGGDSITGRMPVFREMAKYYFGGELRHSSSGYYSPSRVGFNKNLETVVDEYPIIDHTLTTLNLITNHDGTLSACSPKRLKSHEMHGCEENFLRERKEVEALEKQYGVVCNKSDNAQAKATIISSEWQKEGGLKISEYTKSYSYLNSSIVTKFLTDRGHVYFNIVRPGLDLLKDEEFQELILSDNNLLKLLQNAMNGAFAGKILAKQF